MVILPALLRKLIVIALPVTVMLIPDELSLEPPCFRGVLHSALGAPVTGRDRPALFRRETPGPVQRSASAGSHQPPALFRGSCSVFFPSQSFAKIKDIVPALPGFVNPGFPGKFPSSAAKMLTKQPPALIIRKNTRRFPPLKRRRRSVI